MAERSQARLNGRYDLAHGHGLLAGVQVRGCEATDRLRRRPAAGLLPSWREQLRHSTPGGVEGGPDARVGGRRLEAAA